jgi:acetylornithine aminotransferase
VQLGNLGARWQAAMMNNYGTPPLALVRGHGAEVWDEDGRRYLDLLGGIAGQRARPRPPGRRRGRQQADRHAGPHVEPLHHRAAAGLAERLLELLGRPGRVLFCNSGAEANEAAFKMARRTGRPHIIAAEEAFHGRTMGALALTGQPSKRTPFEPLTPGVSHVPYGDVAALAAAVDSDTAAVFLEPIMGEAGAVTPPSGYLAAAQRDHRRARRAARARRGADRHRAHRGLVRPPGRRRRADVVTLAKGLGGGLPIGACIGLGAAAELFEPGQHGTTFGGNPVCAAAALAVLDTIAADGLLEHTALLGKSIATAVEGLGHPLVRGVDGAGLLIGILLSRPVSAAVVAQARAAGFLVNNAVPDRVRLAPPLVLTEEQAAEFLIALPGILDAARV